MPVPAPAPISQPQPQPPPPPPPQQEQQARRESQKPVINTCIPYSFIDCIIFSLIQNLQVNLEHQLDLIEKLQQQVLLMNQNLHLKSMNSIIPIFFNHNQFL